MIEFETTCIETEHIQPRINHSRRDTKTHAFSQFAHSNGFAESPNSQGNLNLVGFVSPFADSILDSLP